MTPAEISAEIDAFAKDKPSEFIERQIWHRRLYQKVLFAIAAHDCENPADLALAALRSIEVLVRD